MVMLSRSREVGEFRKRYKWMALVVVVIFMIVITRLIQLQLIDHDRWARIAQENITKTIGLPATRGVIRDSRGRTIATNRPSYNVYVTPQQLKDDEEEGDDIELISSLMDLNAQERASFERRLARVPARRRNHQIRMFTDVTRDQVAALSTYSNDLPAVDVIGSPVRTYSYGRLAAHAIGYMNEVSAEDLERHPDQGYRAGDRIGRMGLEKAWESYLRGRRGYRRVTVDARGRRQNDPQNPEQYREPIPGRDLVLTLDMELMRTIERAFGGHPGGSAVVVDVRTGRIRALFSKPTYDLNEMSGRLTNTQYRGLRDNPFRPLIDKTVYESYFPGSTFKPITALAALNESLIDPARQFECIGYLQIGRRQRLRCTAAHGDVDMRSSIVQSCNIYFWKIAEMIGLEGINQYAREMGLAERTGIGINTEARGFLASRSWYEEHFGRFRLGYTLNTAIGQGNTRTTLIQLAMMYGAMANGGTLYAPQIVEAIQDPNGAEIESFDPQIRRRLDIEPQHLAYVVDGMRGVVNEQNGTAYGARIEHGIDISGKTGTAEIARGSVRRSLDPTQRWYFMRSHAWFAGFAPSDDPELAIVVLIEHGGAGGKMAAPIGIRVLQEYLGGRTATASTNAPTRGSR